MIIYGGANSSSHSPFGATDYKSVCKRKPANIRAKTVKRITQRSKQQFKVKKVNKSKKQHKKKKNKRLSAKNVKFLKRLGLKVKKQ